MRVMWNTKQKNAIKSNMLMECPTWITGVDSKSVTYGFTTNIDIKGPLRGFLDEYVW